MNSMTCICPECKNNINLSRYQEVKLGMVIECDRCGMTLLVKNIQDNVVSTEIVDEGK